MKYLIIFIVLFASYILAKGQDTTKSNKPIETGFVFIDGKYIEPPYIFSIQDDYIFVNNEKVNKVRQQSHSKEKYFDYLPEIPQSLNKQTSIDDLMSMTIPLSKKLYFSALQGYLFSHFSGDVAKVKLKEIISSLPNVKSFNGSEIVTYSGEKRSCIFGGSGYLTLNEFWGPSGIKPDLEKEYKNNMIKTINDFKNKLNQNQAILYHHEDKLLILSFDKFTKMIAEIDSIKKNEKNEKSQIVKLMNTHFLSNDTICGKLIMEKLTNTVILNKRIAIVKKKINKKDTIEKNDVNDNLIKKNSNSKTQQKTTNISNAVTSTTTSNICNSPFNSSVFAACSNKFVTEMNPESEFQSVSGNLYTDYNFVSRVDETIGDNDAGNLSYNYYKNQMSDGGIIYLTAHGIQSTEATNGIILVYMKDLCYNNNGILEGIKPWLGLDCDATISDADIGIFINQDTDEEWWDPALEIYYYPWVIIANSAWFEAYWQQKINANNAMVIISSCFSAENQCTVKCIGGGGGGVAFGYDNFPYYKPNLTDVIANNEQLLQHMNGSLMNGSKRTASSAFNDMVKLKRFTMSPASAKITLCPGLQSYFPSDGSCQTNAPTKEGYFEFDTWCEQTDLLLNSPLTLTVEASGDVTLPQDAGKPPGNIRWDNVDGSKASKLLFNWIPGSGGNPYKITATLDGSKVKSFTGTSTVGHSLDVDNKEPNGDNLIFVIEKSGTSITTLSIKVTYSNQKSAQGLNFEFEGSTSSTTLNTSLGWQWNFGDGSNVETTTGTSTTTANHSYTTSGIFEVTLVVDGITCMKKIVVINPDDIPPLDISCYTTPQVVQLNSQIIFNASIAYGYVSGREYSYFFQIFDQTGHTLYEQTVVTGLQDAIVSFTLYNPSVYSYEVTVFDNYNQLIYGHTVSTLLLTNPNPAPNVWFIVEGNPVIDNNLIFNAYASGGTPPYTFTWQFGSNANGDGAAYPGTSGWQISPVSYYANGTYPVWVFVTDAYGWFIQYDGSVTIAPPPPPSNCWDMKINNVWDNQKPSNYEYAIARMNDNCSFMFGTNPSFNGRCSTCYNYDHIDWYRKNFITDPNWGFRNHGDLSYDNRTFIWNNFDLPALPPNNLKQRLAQVQAVVYSGNYTDPGYPACYGESEITVGIVDCDRVAICTSNPPIDEPLNYFPHSLFFHNASLVNSPFYYASGDIVANSDVNNYINTNAVVLEACNFIVLENNFVAGGIGAKNFIAGGNRLAIENCHNQWVTEINPSTGNTTARLAQDTTSGNPENLVNNESNEGFAPTENKVKLIQVGVGNHATAQLQQTENTIDKDKTHVMLPSNEGETNNDSKSIVPQAPISNSNKTNVNTGNQATNNKPYTVSVYPNPNTGKFLVEISGAIPVFATVELRDLLGKTVYSSTILQNSNTIDLTASPSGIYFITVCAGKDCWLGKVVKE